VTKVDPFMLAFVTPKTWIPDPVFQELHELHAIFATHRLLGRRGMRRHVGGLQCGLRSLSNRGLASTAGRQCRQYRSYRQRFDQGQTHTQSQTHTQRDTHTDTRTDIPGRQYRQYRSYRQRFDQDRVETFTLPGGADAGAGVSSGAGVGAGRGGEGARQDARGKVRVRRLSSHLTEVVSHFLPQGYPHSVRYSGMGFHHILLSYICLFITFSCCFNVFLSGRATLLSCRGRCSPPHSPGRCMYYKTQL
jgi:hypothetical protein